ncbi:sensor domain-containing diguanylate cyclase [Ideonella alba]|uniref:sensor domain-containing diguanylate cyclase n=1 Tax=Ideonella alba TaxID=2824118 RepID=UPI00287308BC|nr:diguanylate cyclase [Ideonella alba]
MPDLPEFPLAPLFEHLADAVYLIDPEDSRIVWGNRAAWAMLGLSPREVIDHSVLSLQMDVTGLPQWQDIAQAIRASECFTFVGRHRHAAGHEVPVEVNTTQVELNGKHWFLSVARDVGRRLALERELRQREHQLWFALNEATDGLWDWDIAAGTLFFSPQLKRMLGYGPDEMHPVLSTWSDNIHPDDAPRVMAELQAHLNGQRARYEAEYRLRNRNGVYLWVHDVGRVCDRDERGQPTRAVGMVQDVTERKELQLQLERIAVHDFLTGLANRREGMAYLEAQVALCRRLGLPLALCFIDIDHFKSINDSHGHAVGDEVLRCVAHTLRALVRREDLVCRWGGEEFVLIAPGIDAQQGLQLAEKVCAAVQALPADGLPAVTVSIGVAALPAHGPEPALLIEQADRALYQAKRSGRNRVLLGASASQGSAEPQG